MGLLIAEDYEKRDAQRRENGFMRIVDGVSPIW